MKKDLKNDYEFQAFEDHINKLKNMLSLTTDIKNILINIENNGFVDCNKKKKRRKSKKNEKFH